MAKELGPFDVGVSISWLPFKVALRIKFSKSENGSCRNDTLLLFWDLSRIESRSCMVERAFAHEGPVLRSPALLDMVTPGTRTRLSFVDGWDAHADRPAFINDRETVSYGELEARVAAAMELVGFERRLVLIELQNTVSAIVGYLAALRAGHVVLIASDMGTRESLVEIYDPDVVVGPDANDMWQVTERRAGTRHDLHPDLALLVSTSGSTGSPKLVRLSYENLDSNARSIGEYLDYR